MGSSPTAFLAPAQSPKILVLANLVEDFIRTHAPDAIFRDPAIDARAANAAGGERTGLKPRGRAGIGERPPLAAGRFREDLRPALPRHQLGALVGKHRGAHPAHRAI